MLNFSKKLFPLLVVAGLIVGACSSSAATNGANNPVNNPSGNVPANLTSTPTLAPTPTPMPTDADSLLTSAIASSATIKSVHLDLQLSGTIDLSKLGTGSSNGLSKLDGTTLTGDIDVTNKALDLKFNTPILKGLSGEIIVVNEVLYYKTSLGGAKYTSMSLANAALPLSSASPGALASLSLDSGIAQLRQSLTEAGVTVQMVGVEPIAGQDAYHFVLTLPLDKINAALAAQTTTSVKLKLTSASADFWLYTKDLTMAQVVFKAVGTASTLNLTMTLSNYGTPVTITAPPAAQVVPGS
jgi:hypothetical protein